MGVVSGAIQFQRFGSFAILFFFAVFWDALFNNVFHQLMLQQHVLSGKRWNTKICCKNLATRSKSFQPSLLLISNQISRCKEVAVNSEFWFILSCWQSCTVIPRSNPLRQRHFSSYFADISWTEDRSCFSNKAKAKSWSNLYAFLPCCSFEATVHWFFFIVIAFLCWH